MKSKIYSNFVRDMCKVGALQGYLAKSEFKRRLDEVIEEKKHRIIKEIMKTYHKYPDICNELNELLNNIK